MPCTLLQCRQDAFVFALIASKDFTEVFDLNLRGHALYQGATMRTLEIHQSKTLKNALRRCIRHSRDARNALRLCSLIWVASGKSCREVGNALGISPRAVENWARRYLQCGEGSLHETKRRVRGTRKLTVNQWHQLEGHVRKVPPDLGYNAAAWSSALLSHLIHRLYGVRLSPRHCRRLVQRLKASETCAHSNDP